MNLNKEAAAIVGSLVTLATAVIGLLVAFGINVSEEQRNAIIATLVATCGVMALVGPIIRQFVWSRNTTANLVQEAANTGKVPDEAPKLPVT